MRIEIFPSASGDCLLITSRDGKRLLADAGLPDAYDTFIAASLSTLRANNHPIDVVYVSHVDRDHIGGVLRLLDHEVKWRAFDYAQANNGRLKKPAMPRPPVIGQIWHNAFLEDIERTEAVNLGAALASSANTLAGLNAALMGTPESEAAAARAEMLALSVGDALAVNWRIASDQLDIPLNPDFGGKLMIARPDQPIDLGSLRITVLGPTTKELRKFRADWIRWLKDSQAHIERMRRRHQREADTFSAGTSPLKLADLARDVALEVEADVTPPNLASLVLLIEEDGSRVLLTGDAGDESLLDYIEAAGLFDSEGRVEFDVLKVPHHGAHNSFSQTFVERVRAQHYIFCGDGDHHNPEPEVVAGYLRAVKARPLSGNRTTQFWFNWSSARAVEHLDLWKKVEDLFKPGKPKAAIKRNSLRKNDRRQLIDLG